MTAEARVANPNARSYTGVVVGTARSGVEVRVKRDGQKSTMLWHESVWEPLTQVNAPVEVWLEFFDGTVRGVSVYVPEWYDGTPLQSRLQRIKDNGVRYVRADGAASAK
jgi:hypothetical protein